MAEPAAPAEPAAAVEQEEEEHDDKEEETKGRELLQACQAGDAERVQMLLRVGAPPYYQARGGRPKTMRRSIDRSIVSIQLLPFALQTVTRNRDGSRLRQEPEGGTSCLMHAARGGHLSIVRALLTAGAPWNALDRQGKCAGEHAMAAMAGPGVRM